MGINFRLKEILEIKKLNIKEFSEVSGLAYRTAQNYLSGDRKPDAEGFLKISTHLGVNLNWLIAGIGEPFHTANNPQISQGTKTPNNQISMDEEELLDNYRQASDNGKFVILSVAQGAEKKEAEIEIGKVA